MDEFGGAIRVLHVDDDPDLAELTAIYLTRENGRISVETASGADAALDRLDGDVDCVVADYEMPGRNGIELLEAVRERAPDLPYILYTGKGSEEIASEAISAGVTDYLQKGSGTGQYAVLANRIENAVEAIRSERLLTRRTHRLERLISNLPGMVYRCRNAPNWPMETVEGEIEALSGYDAAELERGDVSWGEHVIHPDDRDGVWQRVQDSLAEDGSFELRYRIQTRDGETRWVWERGRGVYEDGELVAIEGFVTDVSEHERHEKRLEETTARLETMFEQSPDMINVHDAEGTIFEPNARLCEETGYGREELVGMKVWEIDRSIDDESAAQLWERMAPGDSRRIESEYERADGSAFPVEVHIRRIDAVEPLFAVISRDITERKERERRLERFASVLSHDLRNPLNVAQGRLELAAEDCDSEHHEHVADAHERMNTLIDSLLDLARDGDVSTEPVSLAAVVDDAWANVDTGDATLRSLAEGRVLADRSRLEQLFENLFRNSVEHGSTGSRTPSGDSVEHGATGSRASLGNAVEHGAPTLTVTVGDLDDGFYVEDDGPGIPEGDREDVLDTGYTTGDGTGFGLSIVEQVADAHGWDVDVGESEAGGARFEFTGVDAA